MFQTMSYGLHRDVSQRLALTFLKECCGKGPDEISGPFLFGLHVRRQLAMEAHGHLRCYWFRSTWALKLLILVIKVPTGPLYDLCAISDVIYFFVLAAKVA